MKSRQSAINDTRSRFAEVGIPEPRLDAQLLLLWACGIDREELLRHPNTALSDPEITKFEAAVSRRLQREPVSRIIGRREFWGLEFLINSHVLDPRPDSEILVETALKLSKDIPEHKVLDLGTGSGCLLLAYLSEREDATGLGVDRSQDALLVANKNATHLQMQDRARFQVGHWCHGLTGYFSIILCNPPYIAVSEKPTLAPEVLSYDPAAALFAEANGLHAYVEILADIGPILAPDARIFFECGWQQAEAVRDLMWRNGWQDVEIVQDLAKRDRVVHGVYAATPKKV